MHIAQSENVRGQVTLTLDYRANEGARRAVLTFTGDDIGLREEVHTSARDEALRLLTEFVNTANGDLKAKRIRWRGV